MIVFVDSGVLGLLTNPKKEGRSAQCEDWLYSLLAKGVYVVSSDICDYEVRRSLLWESAKKNSFDSLNNLDELRNVIDFLKLETEVIFNVLLYGPFLFRSQPLQEVLIHVLYDFLQLLSGDRALGYSVR